MVRGETRVKKIFGRLLLSSSEKVTVYELKYCQRDGKVHEEDQRY